MTTLTVTFLAAPTAECIDRINGSVCCNGSYLVPLSRYDAALAYPADKPGFDRTDLTPTEIMVFVRNFLDDGFDERIIIS